MNHLIFIIDIKLPVEYVSYWTFSFEFILKLNHVHFKSSNNNLQQNAF